jgi:hypothetical protein
MLASIEKIFSFLPFTLTSVFVSALKKYSTIFINKMSDNNSSGRMVNLNPKNLSQGPNRSLSPSSLVNQVIVSSRHPYITDSSRPTSTRSTSGSNSSNSRARQTFNGRSSIQMEPGLQSLLLAEGKAAEMIATARAKRNELMRLLLPAI